MHKNLSTKLYKQLSAPNYISNYQAPNLILQKQLSVAIVFNQAVFNTVFSSLHSFHAGSSMQAKNADSSSLHAGSILRKLGFAQKIGARGNVSPPTSLQRNIYTRVFNASYTQAASVRSNIQAGWSLQTVSTQMKKE